MNKNTISFDLAKSNQSSRVIKAEADKISRQADKLARAVEESYQWWVGDSHARFVRRAESLIKGMRKAADKINNMSETMTNAGEFWKEEEERIARELRALGSLMEGAIQPASDGKKVTDKKPITVTADVLNFINEVENKGVPFPKDWSHSDKVEFSYRYLSELDQIFARIDTSYETTDKLVNYDIAKMAEEEFLFLSDLDLAMHLTLEQRLRVRELFIEDKRYLNKVQDYLQELGFSKKEASSISWKISSSFVASEMGMSYHDWYTFMVAFSFVDGASRFEEALKLYKNLQDNWQVYKIAKVVKSDSVPKAGSLSNLHARQWYINQLARIPNIMDKTKPLEYQARQAFDFRNQVRTHTRNAMYDRVAADRLFGTKPNMTWEQIVQKYTKKGLQGDSLYREIIKASQRSDHVVNEKFGMFKK